MFIKRRTNLSSNQALRGEIYRIIMKVGEKKKRKKKEKNNAHNVTRLRYPAIYHANGSALTFAIF